MRKKRHLIFFALIVGLFSGCASLERTATGPVPGDSEIPQPRHSKDVTIYRDKYGTPHIFAANNYGVYFGYGYAVAQDRLLQMEMLKRTTEGRVAEVLGSKYLELDELVRTSYDHRAVRRQLDALAAADREILQAYADGFTHRVKEVLADTDGLLPAEFTAFDFLPQAWTAYDVAMIFVGAIAHRYSDFNSELDNLRLLQHLERMHGKDKAWQIFNASKWLLDDDSPTTVPRSTKSPLYHAPARPDYLSELSSAPGTRRIALGASGEFLGTTATPELAGYLRQRFAEQGFSFSPEFSPASNFWSVNKLRDANAALVNGPQFGWSVPSYVYGVGLHGGDFNVAGNTLLALPTLLFAHNNHIGWGSTAGLSDQVDVFVERLNPQDAGQYWHEGVYKQFDSWQEVIAVRDAKPVTVTARRSVHGMVQSVDLNHHRAYTRARAWEGGELQTLMAWINLAKDKTLDAAQQRLAAISTNINFYYMDSEGGLGYTHGGRYPKRAPGQDPRIPTPGGGEWDWQGYRPYSENPTIRNPQQGYIANWNNRPSADWASSDLWTYTWSRADRARLIFDAIEAQDSFLVEEIWDINQSVSFDDVSAPFLLPYLFSAWQGAEQTPLVARALALIAAWDNKWLADQQGYYGPVPAIMEGWLRRLLEVAFKDDIGADFFHLYAATNYPHKALGASMFTAPGGKALLRNLDQLSSASKLSDYDFFNGKDYKAVLRKTFADALQALRSDQGAELQQWRIAAHPLQWQAFNFRGVPQALPNSAQQLPAYMNLETAVEREKDVQDIDVHGRFEKLVVTLLVMRAFSNFSGALRACAYFRDPTAVSRMNRGSENNLFIARGGAIEAYDVIPPGQSGYVDANKKASSHHADQMEMFTSFGYKAVPFSRSEVEKSASSVTQLNYSR